MKQDILVWILGKWDKQKKNLDFTIHSVLVFYLIHDLVYFKIYKVLKP